MMTVPRQGSRIRIEDSSLDEMAPVANPPGGGRGHGRGRGRGRSDSGGRPGQQQMPVQDDGEEIDITVTDRLVTILI